MLPMEHIISVISYQLQVVRDVYRVHVHDNQKQHFCLHLR